MTLTASIVVNTYNRARSLERLLPAFDHLDGARFEVVVVNGPSTDDTEAVLAEYGSRLKVARCHTPNLSRSRNIGIEAAAGDVVVFIDDDAIPAEPAWLARLLEIFDRDIDGRIGAAGGASIHRDTDWTEFAGGWTSDFAEQRFTDLPDVAAETGRGRRARRSRASTWYRRTVGNNSAFRRSALVAIGGFDEHFPYRDGVPGQRGRSALSGELTDRAAVHPQSASHRAQ
jgi:glycogen synthase